MLANINSDRSGELLMLINAYIPPASSIVFKNDSGSTYEQILS
jgi:hypothetical protein